MNDAVAVADDDGVLLITCRNGHTTTVEPIHARNGKIYYPSARDNCGAETADGDYCEVEMRHAYNEWMYR